MNIIVCGNVNTKHHCCLLIKVGVEKYLGKVSLNVKILFESILKIKDKIHFKAS
jgi:hypothetical protein